LIKKVIKLLIEKPSFYNGGRLFGIALLNLFDPKQRTHSSLLAAGSFDIK